MAKKLDQQKVNKSAMIHEAIAKGIEKPQEIVEHVKKTHGVTLDARYISVVKANSRKRGHNQRDVQKDAMLFVLKAGSVSKAAGSVESLRKDSAVDFVLLAGGIDQALGAIGLVSDSIK